MSDFTYKPFDTEASVRQQVKIGLLPPSVLENDAFVRDFTGSTKPPSEKSTFERTADKTLEECQAIYRQRGKEYADSWALENAHTPFLDNLHDGIKKKHSGRFPVNFTPEENRLQVLACMLDVKLSRLIGPWKKDTVVDLVAYLSAYTALREEYEES